MVELLMVELMDTRKIKWMSKREWMEDSMRVVRRSMVSKKENG